MALRPNASSAQRPVASTGIDLMSLGNISSDGTTTVHIGNASTGVGQRTEHHLHLLRSPPSKHDGQVGPGGFLIFVSLPYLGHVFQLFLNFHGSPNR